MSKEFPNPCCRCGFCCLVEQCPISKEWFGYVGTCPALLFENDGTAFCSLISQYGENALGIGEGCCIKARVFKGSGVFAFASLPDDIKRNIASTTRGIVSTCEPIGMDEREKEKLKEKDLEREGKIQKIKRG